MLDVVLVNPRIATNTGNIIRLCANSGARLNLVQPLGFRLDDAGLRRAGLDYHDLAEVRIHETWAECVAFLGDHRRILAACGSAPLRYDHANFREDDVVVFGCEPDGLDPEILSGLTAMRIPMREGNRSLNLANAVAVVVYEAWRQHDFVGGAVGKFAEAGEPE
jgi:tRNA (cytidine/uridine-2'-O-)-methyltransferase